MQVTGNTISAWIDTGGGWKLVGSRTDSTYSQAGYIGAELYGGTSRSLDDFGGGTAGQIASAPVNTALPVIGGTARVGSVLSVSTGSWSGSPTPTYGYQWLRCDSGGLGCASGVGARSGSYTAVSAWLSITFRALWTATNNAGRTSPLRGHTAASAP